MDTLTAAAKAEFEGSAALRAEFIDLATYTAWCKADAAGRIKILGRNMAKPMERAATRVQSGDPVAAAKAEFENSAALRAEFIDLATYTAWRKANAEGRVKVLGRRNADELTARA